jgi:frataxin-like iron-binding protein CyaY
VAAADSGQLRTSTDTITWVTRTSQFGATTINKVAFANGLWVAAGDSGQLRTSTDAITWVTRTSTFNSFPIYSVAFGNGVWVAVGFLGKISTSTDAITWVTGVGLDSYLIKTVAFGSGLFVLGGIEGTALRASTDGITWVTRTSQFTDTAANEVAFANSLWVAVGYGGSPAGTPRISTSTDTITWVTRSTATFNTEILLSVAYGNNLWVVVGSGGQLATSTNGITWVTRTSGFGSVPSTTVTSPNALAEYNVPGGSVVALSGVNSVDSEQAFVEYATLENPLIGLVDGDILEIDTYSQEVSLNGDSSGNRFYLETLADWVNLNKGSNTVELSYLENLVTKKSLTSNVATIQTLQNHNFRVGDDVKIQDVDAVFDGTYTITSISNPTSFSFTKNNINVALTDVTSPNSVVAYADSHVVVYYRSGWLG